MFQRSVSNVFLALMVATVAMVSVVRTVAMLDNAAVNRCDFVCAKFIHGKSRDLFVSPHLNDLCVQWALFSSNLSFSFRQKPHSHFSTKIIQFYSHSHLLVVDIIIRIVVCADNFQTSLFDVFTHFSLSVQPSRILSKHSIVFMLQTSISLMPWAHFHSLKSRKWQK